MLGNRSHGKSTVVRALGGQRLVRWARYGDHGDSPDRCDDYTSVKIYCRILPEEEEHNFRCFPSASFLDARKRVILPSSKDDSKKVLAGPGAEDEKVNSGEWQVLSPLSAW